MPCLGPSSEIALTRVPVQEWPSGFGYYVNDTGQKHEPMVRYDSEGRLSQQWCYSEDSQHGNYGQWSD